MKFRIGKSKKPMHPTPEEIRAELIAQHREGAKNAPTAEARANHAESLRIMLGGKTTG